MTYSCLQISNGHLRPVPLDYQASCCPYSPKSGSLFEWRRIVVNVQFPCPARTVGDVVGSEVAAAMHTQRQKPPRNPPSTLSKYLESITIGPALPPSFLAGVSETQNATQIQ